jgi:hypothetical protein
MASKWTPAQIARAKEWHRLGNEDGKVAEELAIYAELRNELGEKNCSALLDSVATCIVCGAPIAEDGKTCTGVNATYHLAPPDPNAYVFSEWYQQGIFHTRAEAEAAPPISFLIKDFLQCEGVTAIAGPVRERKSLIALNVAHALVTGEKLFDHFEVVKRPKRVIYLTPENSLGPFTDRVKKIGLLDYVGTRFFYRTLSADGQLKLNDEVFHMAVPDSVIFLDTAIRFLEGDENSSKDVRAFADTIFNLLKLGAEAVVIIHHSPKATGDSMTLENAMRGSGDMGAFLACCWGTKLQDPENPYKSTSFLSNLKQRDFESTDFELTCGEDCRMRMVQATPSGVTASAPVRLKPRRAFAGNKDGKDPEAVAFIKANHALTSGEFVAKLAERGIKRGRTWVQDRKADQK